MRMATWGCPEKSLSGKPGTHTVEFLQRRDRKQGQILKAAHHTDFFSTNSSKMSSVKEHEVSEGLQAARWGFSLGTETSSTPPGGQLRQRFGHAFIYHCLFPPVQLQVRTCLMLLDVWSFSKIAEVVQLFFCSLLILLLTLSGFIFFYLIAKYPPESLASEGEGGSEQTQPGCLPFLCSLF